MIKKRTIVLIEILTVVTFLSGCTTTNNTNDKDNPPVSVINMKNIGNVNQILYFDSSSSYDDNIIVEYNWDFGDNTTKTTTDKGVYHKYDKIGNYTVNLTVLDNSGNSHISTSYVNLQSNDEDGDGTPDNWGDAYNFQLKTLEGLTFYLSDFMGKVVLLDLMGVDCPYCVYMMPVLKAISENYTKFDLAIISIDVYIYETEEYLQSFIDYFDFEYNMKLDWFFGKDKDGSIAKIYVQEGGVPKVVIVDQNGNIYYSNVGYTEYSELVNQLNKII